MPKITVSIECEDSHEAEVVSKLSEIYLLGQRYYKKKLHIYQCNAILETLDEFQNSVSWCLDHYDKRNRQETREVNATAGELLLLIDKLKDVLID